MSNLTNAQRNLLPLEDFAFPEEKMFPILDDADLSKIPSRLPHYTKLDEAGRQRVRERAIAIGRRKNLRLPASLEREASMSEVAGGSCACDGLTGEAKAACEEYVRHNASASAAGESSVTFSADESQSSFAKEVARLTKKEEGGFADPARKLFWISSQRELDNLTRVLNQLPVADVYSIATHAIAIARKLLLKVSPKLEVAAIRSGNTLQSEPSFSNSEQTDEALADVAQAYEYAAKRNANAPASTMPATDDENLQQATEQAEQYVRVRNGQMQR